MASGNHLKGTRRVQATTASGEKNTDYRRDRQASNCSIQASILLSSMRFKNVDCERSARTLMKHAPEGSVLMTTPFLSYSTKTFPEFRRPCSKGSFFAISIIN